jgi:polysaccharide biosynthesis protein PslH
VREKMPNAVLHIAGRNTPDWLLSGTWAGVNIAGEVADAAQFIAQHDIMLVPLHSGGGMRVKILEGMALEKVIITTTLGIEGIGAQHGQEALIADNAADFAQEIINALANPDKLDTIAKNARDFVVKNYDNQIIAQKLLDFYAAQQIPLKL